MKKALFYRAVRHSLFGGHLSRGQVEHIEVLLDELLRRTGHIMPAQMAYILATAFHETDRFRAFEEYASGVAYEGRKDLGNIRVGDGPRYKGRGYVQLTGRHNYAYWSEQLGFDFIAQPEAVNWPAYAVAILINGMMEGAFTGKALPDYVNTKRTDFYNARRVVNGLSKARLIADYARIFKNALRAARKDHVLNSSELKNAFQNVRGQ